MKLKFVIIIMNSNAITLVTSVVLQVIGFSSNAPAKELLSITRIVSLMCLFLNSLCENISSSYTNTVHPVLFSQCVSCMILHLVYLVNFG